MISVEKIASLTGHRDAVFALTEEGGNSPLFYSSGADGHVVQWDLTKPYDGVALCKVSNSAYDLEFDNESKYL